MDAYAAVVGKRDTRSYTDEPVGDDDLRRVLQAGRMAGSAKNAQLTRLVVVTDSEQRRRLTESGDFTSWIHTAPVISCSRCRSRMVGCSTSAGWRRT